MQCHLLAIETSGVVGSVALLTAHDGVTDVYCGRTSVQQAHAEQLLPLAERLLAERGITRDDLQVIAFDAGPGGFTGLRVACALAQGLGFALNLPLIAVGAHAAVVQQLPVVAGVGTIVALDARMDEAYVSAYAGGAESAALLGPDLVAIADLPAWFARLQALPNAPAQWRWAGDLRERLPAALADLHVGLPGVVQLPSALDVARVALARWRAGDVIAAEAASPVYVRDKVAFTTAERAGGLGGNPRAQAVS